MAAIRSARDASTEDAGTGGDARLMAPGPRVTPIDRQKTSIWVRYEGSGSVPRRIAVVAARMASTATRCSGLICRPRPQIGQTRYSSAPYGMTGTK